MKQLKNGFQKKKSVGNRPFFGSPTTMNICERSFTFMNDISIHGYGTVRLRRHHNGIRIDESNALLQHVYVRERVSIQKKIIIKKTVN